MRNGIIIILLFLGHQHLHAQSEIFFSNWMTGLMEYNPAVAGKSTDLSAAALFRNQWNGFEGAPRAQILSAHKPILSRTLAVGGSVRSVFSKPNTSFGIDANIAYRLRFTDVQLHLGSKLSGTFLKSDFSSLDLNEADPTFESTTAGKFVPNVGFGAYLFNDKWYLSLSAPRMLKTTDAMGSRTSPWYYFSGGCAETISNSFRYRLAFFSGWDAQSPLLLDVNASALFGGKMWLGGHFGTNQYGIYAQYVISPKLYVGYSIDVMNRRNYTLLGNSHEITLRFEMSKARGKVYTFHL